MTMPHTSGTAERIAWSVEEVAGALGISRALIYELLRTGKLHSVKVGRRRLISRKHLEEFLSDDSQNHKDAREHAG
jgi:excisionase family DNA binding protein